ncbi:MAG: AMP-binding protein [Lentisphaeraceae bacterium]|nr:AMP-binding protein [Lentisphaeraceae bacterium]
MEWAPNKDLAQNTNISVAMARVFLTDYEKFYQWSIQQKVKFWTLTTKLTGIVYDKRPDTFLEIHEEKEKSIWLKGAELNIAKSCFTTSLDAIAIKFQENPDAELKQITYGTLKEYCNRIANSFEHDHLEAGQKIALICPMTAEAVAIYIASVLYGLIIIPISADSSTEEISKVLSQESPHLVFTQDIHTRSNKVTDIYTKVTDATSIRTVVIPEKESVCQDLQKDDKAWATFLSSKKIFSPKATSPETPISIFTNSESPITWNHTSPIKMAADGFYHINIQPCDTVCFPSDFDHSISTWLIFSTLINQGTIALYYDCPEKSDFSKFIANAQVNILGAMPELISDWHKSKKMEGSDWSAIKNYISTGNNRDIKSAEYLMKLSGECKPIIEYLIHPELSGAYLTGSLIKSVFPCQFSTPTLGSEVSLEKDQRTKLHLPLLGSTPAIKKPKAISDYLYLDDVIEELPSGYYKLCE